MDQPNGVSGPRVPRTPGRTRRQVASTMLATWLWLRGRARRVLGRQTAGTDAPSCVGRGYRKVFIVGCPRSGTTWFRAILAQHPLVISCPESHVYREVWPRAVEGHGRPRLLRWAAVLLHDKWARRNLFGGLQVFVDRATLRSLVAEVFAHREWSDEEAAEWLIWHAIDEFFAREGGGPEHVFVEKTPGHLQYAPTILRRFDDARVVEVIRDGRDVCVSMEMLRLTKSWPPASRRGQIERWVTAIQQGIGLRSDPAFGNRILLMHYEAMNADPAAEIARLYEFTGLDVTPEFVAQVADVTSFDKKKDPTGPGEHSRKGAVGDWMEVFTEEDEALFRDMVGDLFTQAGYEWS